MKRILLTACLLLLGAGGWFFGKPAYRRFRETGAAEAATTYLQKGDLRNASLCARQALARNPRNLSACRVMAELADLARSPSSIDWYRRLCEIEPSLSNKLCLAGVALRFQGPPFGIASEVLGEIGASGTNEPTFHMVSAELALKSGNLPAAATHFQQAIQLEPANELYRLNLAVVQLQSTNPAIASAAVTTLEHLQSSTNVGTVALRWLIAKRVKESDFVAAQALSAKLIASPRASLPDRLQNLAILRETKDPAFAELFAGVQSAAATNADAAAVVVAWMLDHQMDPRGWLTNCTTILNEAPVRLALADCYTSQKDWRGLEAALDSQEWADLEFLRVALLSRAASEQNQPAAAETRWRTAIREAGDRLGALTKLLSLSTAWGRQDATEALLWEIGDRFPRERWALRELGRLYSTTGNTRGLNRLFSTLSNRDPKDFVSKNNFAATSLLLNISLGNAHQLARELHAQFPVEPVITSTYAYSLHLQGHTAEAIAAMESLKTDELAAPNIALYYGFLLRASGEAGRAAKYLELARTAALLPEERALLTP